MLLYLKSLQRFVGQCVKNSRGGQTGQDSLTIVNREDSTCGLFAIVISMSYVLIATLAVMILEYGLWFTSRSPRRILAALTLSLLLPLSLLTALTYTNAYSLLFLIVAAYRAINLARYTSQRRQLDHLYSAAKQSSNWLLLAQIVTLLLTTHATSSILQYGLISLMVVTVVGCLTVVASGERNLRKTRPGPLPQSFAADDVPTLSVLIPARNETADLSDCLASLIKSTYPKLEIIVLDDCSQNRRTPEIIKGFAHDGVRFIAGGAPPNSWLAKNYAYEQLAAVANGELLLFCGVDTRFQPETLGVMVNELLTRRKTMLSFIPANQVPRPFEFMSILVQPSRYAWELLLPRRVLDRPPVLSTAWLIKHETLRASGGFKSVTRAATPERTLARYAATHDDGYSFIQSDTVHGVSSVKRFSEQQATAIRTRYPQLHQSLELTALTTVLELLLFVLPLMLYVITIGSKNQIIFWAANLSATITIIVYAQICNLTYRKFLLRSVWLLPIAALYDVILLNYSMYKYEFSSVGWKGRNVCIPVMQVIHKLPKV